MEGGVVAVLERMAAETVAIVVQRGREAIAYAEAYEPLERILLVDGSAFSPSTRALPNGGIAWGTWEDPERFETWEALVDEGLVDIAWEGDVGTEAVWSFSWEDGGLWLTSENWKPGEGS